MALVEILTYDPASNAARLRRHPGLALRRAWQILWTFAWFWVLHWWSHQTWLPYRRSALERELVCARYLTNCLAALGPTFVKMGQALSTRPDVLPRTYVQELARLQDRVPAFETRIALAILERELGRPVEELFPTFDPVPISAASIGQVYQARTREGDRVVVKVQRPDLPWILSIDLAVLRLFARYAQWRSKRKSRQAYVRRDPGSAFDLFVKDMPYVTITDQFGKSLFDQTDFVLEGRNAEQFNRSFAAFERVRAPAVYWKYTTRRVITQERIDGVKFNDVAGIEGMGVDFRSVVRVGVRALVKQLLEDGFFHADTHPGNIIVAPNGDVVYIDWGMTDTVPPDLQLKLVDMFLHLVRADYAELVEDLVDLEMFPADVDRSLLVPVITDIYETQLGKRGKHYGMRDIIDRVSDVLYQYPFRLPERFSFLMRTVGTMEGVVVSVWPDFRFLEIALPYAAKLLLTVPDPLIRTRLVDDLVIRGRLDTSRLAETVLLASQETSFRVGEFLPEAVRWLLSREGERLREAFADAISSDAPQAREDLAVVVSVALDAVDLPAPAARLLVAECLGFGRLALGAPDPRIQKLLDWAADWLADPRASQAMGRLGRSLGARWDRRLVAEVFEVVDLALQTDLDWGPLARAGRSLLLGPDGEPWRALLLDVAAAGVLDGRGASLLVRAMLRPDLLWELARAIPAVLLFALSPGAASTRRHLAGIVRRRLLGTVAVRTAPAMLSEGALDWA